MQRKIKFQTNSNEIEVKTIYCIGRNYAEHTKEMNADTSEKPIIFIKPATAIPIGDMSKVELPEFSNNIHHELEIVILISKGGYQIKRQNAMEYISGVAVGLDLTLRDIQSEAKAKGHPWAIAKGFRNSAPISDFLVVKDGEIAENLNDNQKSDIDHNINNNINNVEFELKINDEIRQKGNTSEMVMNMESLVEYVSSIFELQTGDIIYTGTPAGVAKINRGDRATISIKNTNSLLNNLISKSFVFA